jgi:UDP-galactose transporter B1
MLESFHKEIRFLSLVLGLYVSFIYWGYLQEKLTSVKYYSYSGEEMRWDYSVSLNLFMAGSACVAATVVEQFFPKGEQVSFMVFAKAALSLAIASPLGYASLKFINFPLMMLVKSSKPIPVMLMGVLFYGGKYPWYKYVSVVMLCGGIALFSIMKSSPKAGSEDSGDTKRMLIGFALVGVNLFLDGFTNNEQDSLFKKYKITVYQMMKNINLWQFIYMTGFLLIGLVMNGEESQAYKSAHMLWVCPQLQVDVAVFGLCASTGQLLIFTVMKEFGSLLWITISITRKFITVISSVILFNHSVVPMQWVGVVFVFAGMVLEVIMNYVNKGSKGPEHKKKVV